MEEQKIPGSINHVSVSGGGHEKVGLNQDGKETYFLLLHKIIISPNMTMNNGKYL